MTRPPLSQLFQQLVWDEIDRKVPSELPKNRHKLFINLHTAWESLALAYFYKLFERMPRIYSAVINTRDWSFDEKIIYYWDYNYFMYIWILIIL